MRFSPPTLSAVAWTIAILGLHAEEGAIDGGVGMGRREIVEYAVGHFDDVIGDEFGAVVRCDFRMFEAAFPFVNRPAAKVISGHAREHTLEIDLAMAKRAIAG